MTTTTITPFLWFNNTVPQAVEFYKSVFPDTKVEMVSDFMAVFVLQGQRFSRSMAARSSSSTSPSPSSSASIPRKRSTTIGTS